MRRLVTALAALALLLLTAAGMKNADALAQNCRSVSLRWCQPIAAETAEAARENQPHLTFWCEETATLATSWRQTEAAVLYYWGDASLVWGADCLSGGMPAPLDAGGCAVSTALAWQLFGSEDAVGLTLSRENTEYTVRGVFESEEPVALLPKADAAFTAAELPAEGDAGEDPAARVDACLVKSGLPEPDWRLYTLLPAALARLLTLLRKFGLERVQFEAPVESWSEGQRKKLALARSLCQRAHIYLWDEPLNYIDLYARMQIEAMLRESGATLLFVEHDRAFRQAVATGEVDLARV